MAEPVELFRKALDEFDRRVKNVDDSQWQAPTPCDEWDVKALVHHVVYEAVWAPPLLGGQTVEEVGDRFEGDILGSDPKAAWAAGSRDAMAAVERPGAMTDIVHLSFGDMPGEAYLMQLTTDMAVHAWDLARATGADESLDGEVVAACLAEVERHEDMLRGSGMFGEKIEVPADAGAQARLLGLLGRTA